MPHVILVGGSGDGDALFWLGSIALLVLMMLVCMVLLLTKNYKRCPSNRVLVIYGKVEAGTVARTLHGGAAFVVPLVQDFAYLSLDPILIDVSLRGALSSDNRPVDVPGTFTVAIGIEQDVLNQAVTRLLGLTVDEIHKQAEEIVVGQLRRVIASMRIEEIDRDRDAFLQRVDEAIEPALHQIGLVRINMNATVNAAGR